jgi:phosphoserine aminotransferase
MSLVFDFDSTLIKDESLVTLLKYSLERQQPSLSTTEIKQVEREIINITKRGITGEISMQQSYNQRLSVAKPTLESIDYYLSLGESLLTNGMQQLIRDLRRIYPNLTIRVVSQGPKCIVQPICDKFFGIESRDVHAVELDVNTMTVSQQDPMLVAGKSKFLADVLGANNDHTPVVIVGDGVSDMKIKVDGVAHVAIGYGEHLQFDKTKELADHYVTSVKELEPILHKLFSELNFGVVERQKVENFFAGPAALPTEILQRVNRELLSYDGTGISIMEFSHRSEHFDEVIQTTEKLARELLNIPDNYSILFTQGGASLQFSSVPLNLCSNTANYIVTGEWSKKASSEAKKVLGDTAKVNIAVDEKQCNYTTIRDHSEWKFENGENAQEGVYTYYCDNETVHGIEFPDVPQVDPAVGGYLVCDMSSNLMTRPVDVSKYGLIYSCAQKNFGIAGLTLVIIRKDLIGKAPSTLPSLLDYRYLDAGKSLANTPSSFAIYITKLVFEWLKHNGGLEEMSRRANVRSKQIYDTIDASSIYRCPVDKKYRSRLNIVFRLTTNNEPNEALEKKFIKQADNAGLIGLAGHRSVGGIRISLYNAASDEGVERMILFLKQFEQDNK